MNLMRAAVTLDGSSVLNSLPMRCSSVADVSPQRQPDSIPEFPFPHVLAVRFATSLSACCCSWPVATRSQQLATWELVRRALQALQVHSVTQCLVWRRMPGDSLESRWSHHGGELSSMLQHWTSALRRSEMRIHESRRISGGAAVTAYSELKVVGGES